jgi:16S rRNA processing protein RimM
MSKAAPSAVAPKAGVEGVGRQLSPAGDEPAWPEDAVEVGRILDAWGIKGGFKVQAYSANPQALFSSRRWFLQPPEPRPGQGPVVASAQVAQAKAASLPRLLRITQAREQGEWVVAAAQEVVDRNAAEALKGARIFIARSSFPTADANEFYWVDLIGLEVVNREGIALGTVVGLIETGPHCVLRIAPKDVPPGADAKVDAEDSERLIPFVAAFVDAVDLPARRISVDWGLDF